VQAKILRKGEGITGRYMNMELGQSKKFFRVWIGDQEIYLPKSVGDSLLKSHQKGNEVFTIHRTEDVYEIRPVAEVR
jgi:hypothetical protein